MANQTENLEDIVNSSDKNNIDNYLPIPLKHVAAKQLATVPIYIQADNEYCLYSSDGLGFSNDDKKRLLDSNVRYVFISMKDHDKYFDAMAESMSDVIMDSNIDFEEKKEMFHGTAINLANQLNNTAPDKQKVDQTIDHSNNNAQMIMNGMSVKDMYEMCVHDQKDAKHLLQMSSLMQGFAHKLGLNDKHSLSMMGTGAMLHDIGKVFLPKDNRTVEMLRSHVQLGVQHLDTIKGTPMEIRNIVAEHHERIDGSGYPYGLKGDDISLMGQMAGLAYTFDILVNEKPYQNEKKNISEALNVLEDRFAKKFDSNMLKSFSAFASTTLLQAAEDKNRLRLFNVSALDYEHKKNNPNGRRHERMFFRSKGSADILYLRDKKWAVKSSHEIIMHNLSQSGMGFMMYKPIDKGQIVLTKLYVNNQIEPVCLLGKVVRIHEVTKDLFIIGCIFFEINSEEMTSRLYEKFTNSKSML